MNEGRKTGTNSSDSLTARDVKYRETSSAPSRLPERDGKPEDDSKEPALDISTPLNPEDLDGLGQSHREQFKRSGEVDDIEKAIEYFTLALDLTSKDHPDLSPRFANLGVSYGMRFQRLGELDDLNKAIQFNSRALTLARDGDPNLSLIANLGVSYGVRFQHLGELGDLDKAIEYNSRALTLTPNGHSSLSHRLANLGVLYSERFSRLGELNDIEKAIEYNSRALTLTANGQQDLPLLANLGVFYGHRFERLGEPNDIDKAIECNTRALALTPNGHSLLPSRLANLGWSYNVRFQCQGDLDDLQRAIDYKTRALNLTPTDHPDLSHRLANLGASYTERFQRLGAPEDLENTIEHKTRALKLTPDSHPHFSLRLTNLGRSYGDRFQYLGDLNDLEKAIVFHTRALSLTPEDHPDLSYKLANLGTSYTERFRRLGELDDIDKAIQFNSRALSLTPNDHPDLSYRLTDTANAYHNRFQRLGDLDDLQTAIKYNERGLNSTPSDHPRLPARLANAGRSYNGRFQHLGELNDIDRAIEYESRAVALIPNDHPDLPLWLANLGGSYNNRFRHLGELSDIKKAIECLSRAITLTPDNYPGLSHRLANLGGSYTELFRRLRGLDSLEKAIEYQTRALSLIPKDHPDFSRQLANLEASYYDRFQHLGELRDLEKAAECNARALALTPEDHPDLSRQLVNLGGSYTERFWHLGELNDIEKAVEHKTRALKLTPDGHPDLPLRYYGLAMSQFTHFHHTNNNVHAQNSLDSFRKASQSLTGAPRDKFSYALGWAKLASKHPSLNCVEAYQAAIDLLPQFIWLGATTNQRYEDLFLAKGLAVKAASAAILSSEYSLALELLEHARCVVWNQSLLLRSPLDQLQSFHSDLASRLQTVANQLHSASSQSPATRELSTNLIAPDKAAQQHHQLATEYNDLLAQARKLPGFEYFLRPMKVDGLVCAAQHGPIIVINCSDSRCDAIIVLPGQDRVHSLPLSTFSDEMAQSVWSEIHVSLKRQGIRERGAKLDYEPEQEEYHFGNALKLLWNNIVKPVLDYLGYTKNIPTGQLPHITWCPTGTVSFLPLHAAGDYENRYSRVFDYVVSSYSPTLTALLSSTSCALSPGTRVLGVGQETTCIPGYRLSKLPGTIKELELVKKHVEGMDEVGFLELKGHKATKSAVLDAMEQHDWVHLACHAHQNVGDATESGFFLHDGILDLASINRRSFKNKGLAFLSACQTATGDAKLPDEAVHLASGMLMAGYTSVIATMWSVNDADAPFVADKIYGQLMRYGTLGNGEAGKALHDAVAALRDRVGEGEFGRWVPYIHIGS